MERLLIVSNRLPVSISKKQGKIGVTPSVGGLATGMKSFYKTYESKWIGWPGLVRNKIKKHEFAEIEEQLAKEKCVPVYLGQSEMNKFYQGFSNKTIWPLFHYFTQHTVYNEQYWQVYKQVNEKFAQAILDEIRPGDTLWIHDYHLFLLPKMIRDKIQDVTIGFFLHIPFPSYEVFRLLPWRQEIIEGILGSDLVGFHTFDYQRHFISSVRRILGYENVFHDIFLGRRNVKVDIFPMGIDYEKFYTTSQEKDKLPLEKKSRIKKALAEYIDKDPARKIVLSIDRLDYSKGIPNRLRAFELFLEQNKKFHGKVVLVIIAVPSRENVDHYQQLKKEVDELVGRINGRYGTLQWMPIWYLYRSLDFEKLVELYRVSHALMVTPLRDGMNLIAKEYLACKIDSKGVLILSEMAGAVKELGEALTVNPNNIPEMAEALKTALSMPDEQQVYHNKIMQERIKRYNVNAWAGDFMSRLQQTHEENQTLHSRKVNKKIIDQIIQDYQQSKKRLILLDYDGTLVGFKNLPQKAKPDQEVKEIIDSLSSEAENQVVIISGRDRKTLGNWFRNFNIKMVAEHGVWLFKPGQEWKETEVLNAEWKDDIRPILEVFVDRTPGSLIEEKNYSLVWHYRKAEPDFGNVRAIELKEELLNLTSNMNLEILEGNKVLEIKNAGINKGRAATILMSEGDYDFILAIGDDWTDEYLFEALPERAYSIKVGHQQSRARYNIDNVTQVRKLLKSL